MRLVRTNAGKLVLPHLPDNYYYQTNYAKMIAVEDVFVIEGDGINA